MAGLRFVHLRSWILRLFVAIYVLSMLVYLLRMQIKLPSQRRPRVALHYDQPLLNLTNFHYILSADACHPDEEVKALLVITSHIDNVQGRMAWRKGMPAKALEELKVRRIFLLGISKTNKPSGKQILDEAIEHWDIVQGNFLEDYHNLSYKNVMGLEWGVRFCPQAQMLMKLDDDTAIDLPTLLKKAPPLLKNGSMIGPIANRKSKPERWKGAKWQVSLTEWPGDVYPDYFLGLMYMTTPAVASILIAALGNEFFWIDDVFITGVAVERTKVPLIDWRSLVTFQAEELRCCLNGGGCEFLAALSSGDWPLLEQYHRLTLKTTLNRKGRGNCVTQKKKA